MKIIFKIVALVVIIFSVNGCQSVDKKSSRNNFVPIMKSGEMSDVILAYVTRQKTIYDEDVNANYHFPDGLELYFIIYPKNTDYGFASITEYQNFYINGNLYNRFKMNINPHIEIYQIENESFFEEKFNANVLPFNSDVLPLVRDNGFLQKNIICGERLPKKGEIKYIFSFGYDKIYEDFEFVFKIENIL